MDIELKFTIGMFIACVLMPVIIASLIYKPKKKLYKITFKVLGVTYTIIGAKDEIDALRKFYRHHDRALYDVIDITEISVGRG